jgi:hypothetical protein
MINFLQDEMAFVAGLPRMGPRLQVPMPTYIKNAPLTMNTTNNIRVESGSQVGQINAGAIVYLDRAVTTFSGAGMNDLATALQTFTQQVVDSRELSAKAQTEILDLLRAVVEQLPKKKEERNPSILKLALQNIGTLVAVVNVIAPHWEKLKHLLESLFQS